MQFFPKNYEVPKSPSNYMKFEQGQNKFRVISEAIIGYEYWNTDDKPVRLRDYPETQPTDLRVDKNGPSKIKHFWAFTVLDRKENRVKILEITQKGIMDDMKALVDNSDWGDPTAYDITISRKGENLDTKYSVNPSPHSELTAEEVEIVKSVSVNLDALYDGEDPFEGNEEPEQEEPKKMTEVEEAAAAGLGPDEK